MKHNATAFGMQVLPVELPGRGLRRKEPPTTDLCHLAGQAAEALAPLLR